ncbi:MAG TPA: Gfo/Idh/MocA family oxidoreductase [Bacteroidota bacterium]|jgi:predicted dehydrogenase|nr:Gfo/Idh/MocA family oxidoreductase [Bacteroidota bacterium]
MNKVRLGVVGVGSIAQTIHLPILSRMPDVEIVAVCDIDRAKAQYVADKFDVRRYYNNYEKMFIVEQELDGILICTPTNLHKEMAIAASEAKHNMLIEKPLARTAKEAEEIVSSVKKNHVKLMVGMNNRFRPDTMILKSFIEEQALGKIFYAKTGWFKKFQENTHWFTRKTESGGGVVLDLGIVMFDLAFWMMGYPEVKEVMATNYSLWTKRVEDTSIIFIKMKDNSTLTIEVSWSFESTADFFYCDCYGTEGSGLLNPFRIIKRMHGNLVNVAPAAMETPQSLYRKSYVNELKHWIGTLRNLHPIISTGDEAVHRMKIVDLIYKSAKRGKAITVRNK